MELNFKQIELLEKFAKESDLKIHKDYSCRGMKGRKCLGFSGSAHKFSSAMNLVEFIRINMENEKDKQLSQIYENLLNIFLEIEAAAGSLGKERLTYFPDIEIGDKNESGNN